VQPVTAGFARRFTVDRTVVVVSVPHRSGVVGGSLALLSARASVVQAVLERASLRRRRARRTSSAG
jgi:hypothetical protein